MTLAGEQLDAGGRSGTDPVARMLVAAGGTLVSLLDYDETLARLAGLAVPALADYCFFDIRMPGGELRRVGWAHVDPGVEARERTRILAGAPGLDAPSHPIVVALRERRTGLFRAVDDAWLRGIAVDEDHLAVLRRLGPRSVMFVPLLVAESAVGVLTLAMSVSGRRYGPDDVVAAEQLAAQAVTALERTALYREVAAHQRILQAQGEASVDGVLLVSPEGRILSSNRRFAELLGVPPEVIATGDDDAALAAAMRTIRDPAAFLARVRELYADPEAVARDIVELTDGRVLERHTSPVRDDDGRLLGRLWSFRDVTEARRSADALRYQSDLTRTILENAQFGVILMDDRGHVTYANEAWTRITGFSLAEMAGRPAHEIVHHHRPDGSPYPISECPLDRALPERRTVVPYEDVFIRKDGTFFPVRAAASPILRDGTPVGTVVEVQDITEERRTAVALRRLAAAELDRARKLHALIEAMREAVIVVEPDGLISLMNPAARRLFGEDAASLADVARRLGIPVATFQRVQDGSLPPTSIQLGGDRDRWLEIRGYGTGDTATGETTTREAPATPAIYLFRDVTEERRAHVLRDTFIEVLSHELRTPVTTIFGGSRLLARPTLDEDRRREVVADIETEADRLYRLIENLVVMTKAREHALDVGLEPVLLHRLVTGVAATERDRWPDLEVIVSVPPSTPPVSGDGTSIEQVVRNLFGNAAKYGRGRVEIRVETGDGEVAVRVLDDGPGVPSDALPHVFDLFYRTPEAVRRASGAGIGLFVCRHLVEAMGGRIWALNREDGAEFGFALPIATDR